VRNSILYSFKSSIFQPKRLSSPDNRQKFLISRSIPFYLRDIAFKNWLIVVLCLIAAFVLFWELGKGSLEDFDEALFAQISKQIVENGTVCLRDH
jgi:hypothetical protein